MDESTLSRALSGNQNLTIDTMDRLAAALDAAVHIHVEKREVRGGWVPVEQMVPVPVVESGTPVKTIFALSGIVASASTSPTVPD